MTGPPGAGKTTALRRVAQLLVGHDVRGFVTKEIRVGDRRVGFGLETLDGRRSRLAHEQIRTSRRVGRYGVDVAAFEEAVLPALAIENPAELYLIDEIGKMECFSSRFIVAVTRILESRRPLVATVARKGAGFIARVKQREGVEVWELTRANRDEMPQRILRWLVPRLRQGA